MSVIGFHASQEQIHPARLLHDVTAAASAGFMAAMTSDHFAPWSTRQGHAGFAWSWLGAAMAVTDLPMGVVCAPGQRYHPAIVAQAAATLGAMFPGRFWLALGSGQNINEHITGDQWMRKELRDRRLRECVDIIRALLAGEEVSHDGLVTVDRARIWTLPDVPVDLVAPAVTVATARDAATWADGLITVNQPVERLREVVAAYRDNGGRGPIRMQVHVSWAQTFDEALYIAHDQWRSNVFGPPALWDIDSVDVLDSVSADVSHEAVRNTVLVSHDPGRHAAWLSEFLDLGFDELYLHHVGKEQRGFIETFGDLVLPPLFANDGGGRSPVLAGSSRTISLDGGGSAHQAGKHAPQQ